MAVGGLATILVVFLIAAFASFLSPYDPGKTDVSVKLKAPSSVKKWVERERTSNKGVFMETYINSQCSMFNIQ